MSRRDCERPAESSNDCKDIHEKGHTPMGRAVHQGRSSGDLRASHPVKRPFCLGSDVNPQGGGLRNPLLLHTGDHKWSC